MLVEEIKTKYPIHYLVWNNEFTELEKELKLKIVRNIYGSLTFQKSFSA